MTLIDQLAARLGIEERFKDAQGEIRETSADTRLRLLVAMGIHAADEEEAGAALAALEDDEWRRSLPAVRVVIASSQPAAIEVVARAGVRCIRWSLQLESGEVLSGAMDGGTATPVAERRVDGRHLERR